MLTFQIEDRSVEVDTVSVMIGGCKALESGMEGKRGVNVLHEI